MCCTVGGAIAKDESSRFAKRFRQKQEREKEGKSLQKTFLKVKFSLCIDTNRTQSITQIIPQRAQKGKGKWQLTRLKSPEGKGKFGTPMIIPDGPTWFEIPLLVCDLGTCLMQVWLEIPLLVYDLGIT